MVTIIDYGAGNLKSVQKAFEHLGETVLVTSDKAQIQKAKKLVFPGQGAFGFGMSELQKKDLIQPIKDHILAKKPFLGICLGFQLLFESSEEDTSQKGLGIFKGTVKAFQKENLKIPHMGWNNIHITKDEKGYFSSLSDPHVYFVHSFYVDTSDTDIISTTTEYGHSFVSSIQTPYLLATQFHPEKSGDVGLSILRTFIDAY
ncbi:MAG: imidazole glycerol phosphate synthase subunit HisH [Candidatus Margulisbacteria bacterium]|nr:imidazole glycerol phosphate synthase subunit HisH [Candidatus Margulisiibacteriota bacterium]